MTVTQCCELLQVSKQTLYRLINSGELQPIRVGYHPRFSKDDVRGYIERNREVTPEMREPGLSGLKGSRGAEHGPQ